MAERFARVNEKFGAAVSRVLSVEKEDEEGEGERKLREKIKIRERLSERGDLCCLLAERSIVAALVNRPRTPRKFCNLLGSSSPSLQARTFSSLRRN